MKSASCVNKRIKQNTFPFVIVDSFVQTFLSLTPPQL